MYKYGIVAIGYKNAEGIQRLLDALNSAEYRNQDVLLIISIDYSEKSEVADVARDYHWLHGKKIVNVFNERQGLRKHVLSCGEYLNTYDLDALAVFEDDMMPSKDYFLFMTAATEKYINNHSIAGISLYTHCINFLNEEPFIPLTGKGDNYFFQCAQSRGQVWFKEQWNDFISWYEENREALGPNERVPDRVTSWPDTSWLKYHIAYCIENKKYFVYPYISYSTCFGEIGEHVHENTNFFQVPLSNRNANTYSFIDFDDDAITYNAFFENEMMYKYCEVPKEELTVDLYGNMNVNSKKYLLTRKKMPYSMIKSWGNKLIPHELNIVYNIPGSELFLYDLESYSKIDNFCSKDEGKKKKLILYGCGVEGKKWFKNLNVKEEVYGFADSDAEKTGTTLYGKKIYSVNELQKMKEEIEIFISTNKRNRSEIYERLSSYGLRNVIVDYPYRGKEIHIDNKAEVDSETELEGKNSILAGTQIIKCKVGYASYIAAETKFNNVYIGRFSCIGPNVKVISGQHPTNKFVSVSPVFYSTQQIIGKSYVDTNLFKEHRFTDKGYQVEIGNDVWIGADVTLMEGITIADGTIIGAEANVVKNTEPYSIIGGNPAKVIKYRFDREDIEDLVELQWWNKPIEWIEKNAEYFRDVKELLSVCMQN